MSIPELGRGARTENTFETNVIGLGVKFLMETCVRGVYVCLLAWTDF